MDAAFYWHLPQEHEYLWKHVDWFLRTYNVHPKAQLFGRGGNPKQLVSHGNRRLPQQTQFVPTSREELFLFVNIFLPHSSRKAGKGQLHVRSRQRADQLQRSTHRAALAGGGKARWVRVEFCLV